MLKVCFIGSGALLRGCLGVVQTASGICTCLVWLKDAGDSVTRAIEAFCAGNGIACTVYRRFDECTFLQAIDIARPDVTFSLCNPTILSERALKHLGMAINFHNGPLPKYAGVNAPSWALLKGEKQFGVSWHLMAPTIDGGDIVRQTMFSISVSSSVLDLIMKCNAEGLTSFRYALAAVATGKLRAYAQDMQSRTYFSRDMKPYGGAFPFEESQINLDRLQRATAFHPMENTFFTPRIRFAEIEFDIEHFVCADEICREPAGTVVAIDSSGIGVSAAGRVVRIESVASAGKRGSAATAAAAAGLVIGSRALV